MASRNTGSSSDPKPFVGGICKGVLHYSMCV
jgi:hypothetical protein